MAKKVTMSDIAKRVNVSVVTVSKALGDKEGVSRDVRDKIIRLAQEMGYVYGETSSRQEDTRAYSIGVLVHERFMDNTGKSFYWKVYQNINRILKERNSSTVLELIDEESEENLKISNVVTDGKADGVILLGQLSENYVNALCNQGVQAVLLDFYNQNSMYDSVISDSFYGSYMITNHLIANGHKKIAFVGDIHATSSILDRYLGYCKAMIEHGIVLKDEYVLKDRNQEGKFIEVELPKVIPTAFVCNCDQVAYRLINRLRSMNIKVPEEVSVVGFDNDVISTLMEPKLTTVEVDTEQMAEVAVKMIIGKIKGEANNQGRRVVNNKIIYRDSVRKI